jgi:chromosome segregation ATPase
MTEPFAEVDVNGFRATAAADGRFALVVSLLPGANPLRVTAMDASGNARELVLNVMFDDPLPALQASLDSAAAMITALRADLAEARAVGNATAEALAATSARLAAAEATLNATSTALAATRASLENASAAFNASVTVQAGQSGRIGSLESQLANVTHELAATRADLATQALANEQQQRDLNDLKHSATRAEAEASAARAAAEASTALMALVFLVAFAFTSALQVLLYGRLKHRMDESRTP